MDDSPNSSLFKELWLAYLEARKGKRNKPSVLRYDHNAQSNIADLAIRLQNKTWRPGRFTAFLVHKPVLREIFAAPFEDRIVHHFLYRRISPIIEPQLIFDCASCRIRKGTHFAISRVKRFLRAETSCFRDKAWSLQLDIQAYFISIRQDMLFKILNDMLSARNKSKENDFTITDWLLAEICFHCPAKNAMRIGSKDEWEKLPKSKSLYFAKSGCGLPIGNLTSQLFGNVYLNGLDHYIKRELGLGSYSRYVDDLVILHSNLNELKSAITKVNFWLETHRKLKLHPHKTTLQLVRKGIPYLGVFILPGRVYAGTRLKIAWKNCIKNPNLNWQAVQSYLGLLKHYDCNRLSAIQIKPPTIALNSFDSDQTPRPLSLLCARQQYRARNSPGRRFAQGPLLRCR